MEEVIKSVLLEEEHAKSMVQLAREQASKEISEAVKEVSVINEDTRIKAKEILRDSKLLSEEAAEREYRAAIDLAEIETVKFKDRKIASLKPVVDEVVKFLISPSLE